MYCSNRMQLIGAKRTAIIAWIVFGVIGGNAPVLAAEDSSKLFDECDAQLERMVKEFGILSVSTNDIKGFQGTSLFSSEHRIKYIKREYEIYKTSLKEFTEYREKCSSYIDISYFYTGFALLGGSKGLNMYQRDFDSAIEYMDYIWSTQMSYIDEYENMSPREYRLKGFPWSKFAEKRNKHKVNKDIQSQKIEEAEKNDVAVPLQCIKVVPSDQDVRDCSEKVATAVMKKRGALKASKNVEEYKMLVETYNLEPRFYCLSAGTDFETSEKCLESAKAQIPKPVNNTMGDGSRNATKQDIYSVKMFCQAIEASGAQCGWDESTKQIMAIISGASETAAELCRQLSVQSKREGLEMDTQWRLYIVTNSGEHARCNF